mmetsp:Transcript_79798/g.97691  ORF Transcript_79798/g.97691 Transcript_79798/m.97691 type:complete len:238 (-) Transcript_79798:5-718(-)
MCISNGFLWHPLQVADGRHIGFLGCLDGSSSVLQDDLLEHSIVQGKTQADRMCHHEMPLSLRICICIDFDSTGNCFLLPILLQKLCQVSIVVSLHFLVEHNGLPIFCLWQKGPFHQFKHLNANALQLQPDLAQVPCCKGCVFFLFCFLLLTLNALAHTHRQSAAAHSPLKGSSKHFPFLSAQSFSSFHTVLHVFDHVIIALSPLGNIGQNDGFFLGRKIYRLFAAHLCSFTGQVGDN